MKISIISDEISSDPHAAVYIGTTNMDIHHYELRKIMGARVPDIKEEQIVELQWLKSKYDIDYTALAAGLFKCRAETSEMDHQMERFERAIALAHKLSVKTITGFALRDEKMHRPEKLREIVLPYFRQVVERCQQEGLVFAVETEYMTGCEHAKDAKLLVDMVPGLQVNWDPCNSWIAGEHPLEGYEHIRGSIVNVHCKDADTTDWRSRNPFVAFGDGVVPWEELLLELLRDQAVSTLTIETHIKPIIPKSLKSVNKLRSLLNLLNYHNTRS